MNEWQIVAAPPELRIQDEGGDEYAVILLAVERAQHPKDWKTYALLSIGPKPPEEIETDEQWIEVTTENHYLFFPEAAQGEAWAA